MKERFSDEQLVEITALLTLVNLDRFNAAFGIGSAGFSEGMVCVPPDRPVSAPESMRGSTAQGPENGGRVVAGVASP